MDAPPVQTLEQRRRNLRDNPRLFFAAPASPPASTGKHFDPPNRLRDSAMLSVHSKPTDQNQTADSHSYVII
jgi:hypothetical protein